MFDREKMIEYIEKEYDAKAEYLWEKFPEYAVFRHRSNNKWFALVAKVPKDKLGLDSEGDSCIINLKSKAEDVITLTMIDGILPAYHMNKKYWLSVLLDGSVDDIMICELLDTSYELTKSR